MYASTPFPSWYLYTKVSLVLIDIRVKRGKEKLQKKKAIQVLIQLKSDFNCPHLWRVRGTSCLLRSAGGGFSPLKGLPGYCDMFLPHSLSVKH